MSEEEPKIPSVSEFYRNLRPEYFSDSEQVKEFKLPYETLAFEIDRLTTNQKQDQFEVLCRRLCEKFIAPNLIPQVGPTGGGDGKTDSETYSVSDNISDKWYVPENGWEKDEKWAFAISAKKTWKPKLFSDVEKIVETARGYTKIYFLTNQMPSSRLKKEAQEECLSKFGIEVIILDAKWILEKIYGNNLTNLAVESLNLSNGFLVNHNIIGSNDTERLKLLEELEEKIADPKRYFEYDFQLVDDAIEAAIIARMLEKPRSEVEGKFDRAFRLCRKVNNDKQLVRLYYQRAWTYVNWYDDYGKFLADYLEFKKLINENSGINELESLYTLHNLLRNVQASGHFDISTAGINIIDERDFLLEMLANASTDEQKPASALSARSFKALEELIHGMTNHQDVAPFVVELTDIFNKCEGYLDYPFDMFKESALFFGEYLFDNANFDELIIAVASASERRNSELAAGRIFFERGLQKFKAKLHKEAIIYFGKAVLKLAKEETQYTMFLTLRALAECYGSIGLLWSANNCLISAAAIAFKPWFQKGTITKKAYDCVYELALNETLIGRVPSIINWYELLKVISLQVEVEEVENKTPDDILINSFLAIRMLNFNDPNKLPGYLPDILKTTDLWLSEDAVLYTLGQIDVLMDPINKGLGLKNEAELHQYFANLATQPFIDQIFSETNLMSGEVHSISSGILGCRITIRFTGKNVDLLLIGEMLLAFFEAFLGTSLEGVYPSTEEISITLVKTDGTDLFKKLDTGSLSKFMLEIGRCNYLPSDRDELWNVFLALTSELIGGNFVFRDFNSHLNTLFEKEEVRERLGLIFEHIKFTNVVLGNRPKLFLEDRVKEGYIDYPNLRSMPLTYPKKEEENPLQDRMPDFEGFENIPHDQRKVLSIIDNQLWDGANWRALGNALYPGNRFVIFMAFEDISMGEKIFDDWIDKFGREDKNEVIRLTIIKGIDKKNPFHYRVGISKSVEIETIKNKDIFHTVFRGLTVQPNDHDNLDKMVNSFNTIKEFLFCPATFDVETKRIDICFDKGIVKRKLIVKSAWEIGLQDMDRASIDLQTFPIIPDERNSDAPILAVLEEKKRLKK
ncbi:hypothetical protein [Pedobacter antarcticus]|uniref:hypothetical protein n=1 Tax=Pedobacter antarcticus TaxID=34086 RepID=UPI00292D8C2F|nr:hypothetical protein [Pedobacter antarcticus]